jgi:hypothetical protein
MTTLIFEYDVIAECSSVQELSQALIDIYQHFEPNNPVIQIVHPNGNMLDVGISTHGCFANYKTASLEPPYYSSVGHKVKQDGIVEYQHSKIGHVSEIRIRNTISFDRLLDVATEFHQTGEFPESVIKWEMD